MTGEKRKKKKKKWVQEYIKGDADQCDIHTYIHYTEEEETKVEMVQWSNVIPFSSDVCNTVTPPHPSPVQPIFSMASISRSIDERVEGGRKDNERPWVCQDLQRWPNKFVLGCVISPLRQQAEPRNLGQTFLPTLHTRPRDTWWVRFSTKTRV